MILPRRCPVCGGERLEAPLVLPGLQIVRCRACGHRVAIHEQEGETRDGRGPADYHAGYDRTFLESLRATRVRQAGLLISHLRRHLHDVSAVIDYGAGLGWFLRACRAAGIAPVAGVEISEIAVKDLEAEGIEAHLLPTEASGPEALGHVSFRPRVITFLDVIEHFTPDRLLERLRETVQACGDRLELVVVKVPVPGLLYAGANTLSRLGVTGPLRQLYQASTRPPHFNYFSARSAEILLEAAGLSLVERVGDRDFEADGFGGRIGVAGGLAAKAARLEGAALAVAVSLSRRFDSSFLFARPASIRPV